MKELDKILTWIKSIIIDWRIGTVGLVGFTTGLIIIRNVNLIIGVAVTASIIIIDIIDKKHESWYESYLNKKLQKKLADPKYQQQFFDNCSDEKMKILTQLYGAYPNGYPLPSENMAVYKLRTYMAILRIGDVGMPNYDNYGNLMAMFSYTLQPWAKDWLDKHKRRLKKNI